ISIKTKVTEEDFFGPGFSSPFNPGNPDYTMHLIRRLGNILPLLELKKDDVVLDMGAGYAWTTEWLKKMGAESIGIDICRTYLDIGLKRMGEKRPHLVVGDVENLPIKANCLNAVLCYDAFHHIPNRKKCLGNFFKSLKDYGNIALAEPGGTHEFEKISKEVMDKYGILEKGMELDDINDYCDGLKVLPPEQHYILKVQKDDRDKPLSLEFMHTHSYVDCNFFVVKKRLGERDLVPDGSKFKRKVKKGLKRLLKRVVVKLLH
ncbi:MAG: methyltransferase domain-containing protein, partial [bacterium]|nr:methyltransferase domain-containing protein [bacterium]